MAGFEVSFINDSLETDLLTEAYGILRKSTKNLRN